MDFLTDALARTDQLEVSNQLPDYATAVIGNDLQISRWSVPDYDPETIPMAINNPSEELLQLQKDLRRFVARNKQYWTAPSLAQTLGISLDDLKALVEEEDLRGFNKTKAHTVVVLKPLEAAEIDQLKYQGHHI